MNENAQAAHSFRSSPVHLWHASIHPSEYKLEGRMPKLLARTGVIVVCLYAFIGAVGMAQVVGAILTGSVVDPSGAAVPNAQVTIHNLATGIVTRSEERRVGKERRSR